ncbi:MAG: DUF4143 domain-containing protein [Actinomycetota bacterium]|nr:DUF4143 domain-containing protein [Actinomycetota bacterium]
MPTRVAPFGEYRRRVVDGELDLLLCDLAAISLEGPRGVGKTSTARRRGGDVFRLDDPAALEIAKAQPERLTRGRTPIVIDEWQRFSFSWDLVRRAVDCAPAPGRFILTGSAGPSTGPTHTGAGRIVALRMRPMTLPERGVASPAVSISALLTGAGADVAGTSEVTLEQYTAEMLAGGFPGMRHESGRAQRAALGGYLDRIVDSEVPELGMELRRPQTLRRWLQAYGAATATTASYETIRDAAAAGGHGKPAKNTAAAYREVLERIWLLDPLPAWSPSTNRLARLTYSPKHHLADPALAARLAGLDAGALLRGEGPAATSRDGTFLGALFESLATLSVRVFAQAAEARVFHFRTRGGEHEVDLIVERGDGRVVALEVKLAASVGDEDVRQLAWLRRQIGDEMIDAVILTTGPVAYRRRDGVAVVPLALLGP